MFGSDDYETVRGAAWCWGVLSEANDQEHLPPTQFVTELARRHPDETVRIEAVVALGRAGRSWRAKHIIDEVIRRLQSDGSGRVRYGAMQTLRLAARDDYTTPTEAAAAHDWDSDFGVLFERDLILDGGS
jgi:hypothetical protein